MATFSLFAFQEKAPRVNCRLLFFRRERQDRLTRYSDTIKHQNHHPLSNRRAHITHGDAALRVPSQADLFHHIAELIDGWPRVVLEIKLAMWTKYSVPRLWNFPRRNGMLPHMAIMESNEQVLRALFKLRETPPSGALAAVQFDDAMECAIFKENRDAQARV